MGKIRRQRTKLHQSASKKNNSKDVNEQQPETEVPSSSSHGLFGSTNIDLSTLTSRLQTPPDEDDRMSFISKKSLKDAEGNLSKKDKMKKRKEQWMEKIETQQLIKRKKKEAKKRSSMPIVGDLQPLNTALPELSEILKLSEQAGKNARKRQQLEKRAKKSTLATKERNKLLDEETSRFKQVLKHDAFKENPFAAINKHLTLKLQQEEEGAEEKR